MRGLVLDLEAGEETVQLGLGQSGVSRLIGTLSSPPVCLLVTFDTPSVGYLVRQFGSSAERGE